MSIQSQIERIQLNRDIIRAKMVDAGQASLNDDFDTLTENLTVYPIDNSLSNMSENPVQNKVIKGELDKAYKTDDTAETVLADADYIPFYDTSAGGKRRTLWSNVKAKLADTFQKKLTAGELISIDSNNKISSTVPTFANAFSRGDIIDTTERIVGMFMGKPMYQKLIVDTLPETATTGTTAVKNVSLNVNIDKGFVKEAYYESSNTIVPLITFPNNSQIMANTLQLKYCKAIIASNDYSGSAYSKNSLAIINSNANFNNFTFYAIIRYTKTTDTANAIKYGTGNDYSLDEQIVGTWIDGKPLYQKTIDCGSLPDTTYKEIETGLDTTANVVNLFGYTTRIEGERMPLPFVSEKDSSQCIRVYITAERKIYISTGTNRIKWSAYITLQYTKTTD